jgi:hypothetical protein
MFGHINNDFSIIKAVVVNIGATFNVKSNDPKPLPTEYLSVSCSNLVFIYEF